ncbi:MAG: xanthine dehydrogenase accessory protein XdhC [Deltaproteobacteria bacterium]
MSFDRDALAAALAKHGRVARVIVAATKGSVPREVGASMLVWKGGQSGTIGGGALEFQAAQNASESRLDHIPLGPALGQCCGGAVTLLTEVFTQVPQGDIFARPLPGQPETMPLSVKRLLAASRRGQIIAAGIHDQWMVEPVTHATRPLWIWGAGHVGRALVDVLSPLPDFAITWVDTAPDRFPADAKVTVLPAANPADIVQYAPKHAEHLILTFSHALDLDLCHRLLTHGFQSLGLIGSRSKAARFRTRLAQLGHASAEIARIGCPIGDPKLGKHPQAIAISTALALLSAQGLGTFMDKTA